MVMEIVIGWVIMGLIFLVGLYFSAWSNKHHEYSAACPSPELEPTDQVMGAELVHLSDPRKHQILLRRFPYYASLDEDLQKRFMKRLTAFMCSKRFIIKSSKAFIEMPVLVSAAAVQLSFGLSDYLLPFYRYIRIYEEEYFAHQTFRFLAGNVQGNTITVAWNHFLKGNAEATDGSNVGLHEMSHALWFQKMVIDEKFAPVFSKRFEGLMSSCKPAHRQEIEKQKDLYSDYGATDLQEFWAESVELFFEKPGSLQHEYPEVYLAMKNLLNQDPLNTARPLLKIKHPFVEGFIQLTTQLRHRSLNRTESMVS